MARYIGPKLKLSRRVGVPIADIPKHTGKELGLPGMHGYRGRRQTEYGVRLTEKQKLRYHYGMMEKQFRRFLDIASYLCKAGDEITFKDGIHKVLRDNMEQMAGHNVPNWLEWNPAQLTAKVNALPTPEDVPFEVNMNLIIEFYR